MKKELILALFLITILLIAGCGEVSKIGKTCTTECIKEERVCQSTRQVCREKNFWGNCVEFEEECVSYATKCALYDEVCR